MIVKMKKYAFLVYHAQYKHFLEQLREVGVLHVALRPQGIAENDQLREKMQFYARLKKTIEEAEALLPTQATPLEATLAEGAELLSSYKTLQNEKTRLQQAIAATLREAELMRIWGDFNSAELQNLAQSGYTLQCWSCNESKFQEAWVEQFNAFKIGKEGVSLYFVTLNSEPIQLDADTVTLSQSNYSQLLTDAEGLRHLLVAQQAKLEAWSIANLNTLKAYALQVEQGIDLQKVELNTLVAAEEKVMLLQGYCPVEAEQELNKMLDTQAIYYQVEEVDKEDAEAPIKLKNNLFTRMYEVITQMYGMPEYGEFDPTPIVAPFFTLFFAFCMGDAGYGLILILLGVVLKKKMSASVAGMMNLVITLGVATTVLGAVFGTFFGVELINTNLPESLKSWMIVGKIDGTTYDKQMALALGIGVVHICLAMVIKALSATMRYGFKRALSEWGWLLCVVGFIAIGGLQFLEKITPSVATTSFIVVGSIASIGIFLFNDIRRNVFINIGAGLWDTYNMATGLLGDVLSYIRLYALALAGAMLGLVFNQLGFMIHIEIAALPILGDILTWIACGAILIFGHTLNIAMCCLSAFVHPLRLTFVEYFKNSSYHGKGVAYKPFEKRELE